MRSHRWGAALLVLILGALPAGAADLSKVERTLAKEPAYQGKPKYCLLVFGPEAKTRVWLVLDGDKLHASNSEGDLTGAGSRVVTGQNSSFSIGNVTEEDGTTQHHNLRLFTYQGGYRIFVNLADGRRQGAGYDPDDKLQFADKPQDAPIVHLNGPMQIQASGTKVTLGREATGTVVRMGIGTPGVGGGTFAAFQGCAVPDRCPLSMKLEFPRADAPSEFITVTSALRNRH
jgi:hypothetical protein